MPKPSALEQAVLHLKSHWRDGKSLKELAELFSVDAGNLERAFRGREGMTVKHFVDERRKEHVSSRLADKGVRGYEIGAELGFANDLAFYRWVNRAFGVSFVKLRAQARRKPTPQKRDKKQ